MVVMGLVGMISLLAGCQTDLIGPSMTTKILYKGENDGQEWKSRNVGMTAGSGYSFTFGNFGTNQFSPKSD